MKKLLLITATVFFVQTSNAQTTIDYFGQTPPGDSAVIFAPGIISLTNRMEASITFSPDGNECFFTVFSFESAYKIYYTKHVNNVWSEQIKAPFSANNNIALPFFSADGKKLYFTILNADYTNGDIYMVQDSAGGWSYPQRLPAPINSTSREGAYSETVDGVVYFDSMRPGGSGWSDIWCKYPLSEQAVNLGSIINSTTEDIEPCVAPDGSYIIFASMRNGREGSGHLYVIFNKGNNQWTTAINMNSSGAKINNNSGDHMKPSLSPDGKFLFFGRHNQTVMDIYWVSTHVLDTLKKIAMPTTLVNQAIDKKVMLYPNPTTGLLTLSLGTSQSCESFVVVYNLQGAQVLSKNYKNTSSVTIDLTGNSAGIYVVKVIADGVSYEEKVVKE